MKLTWEQRDLQLIHPWTLSRGTADRKCYWFVSLEQDGLAGLGEAAHNARYGESLETVEAAFRSAAPVLAKSGSLDEFETDQKAARAALDMALWDLLGKRESKPLGQLLEISPGPLPLTSVSIGIDEPETIARKVEELADYPILKVKLGGKNDEMIVQAIRAVTGKLVRVDANEGWGNKETALQKCLWLAEQNVEFVEQPLPAGNLADVAWLRERSPLPIVADEDVKTASDIAELADAYDGINLKLMKAGGLGEARGGIQAAREFGLGVMLGCMIESSLGITAMAHLGSLADWLDLDGNLLVSNDPFVGVRNQHGKLLLPEGHGLGVQAR